MEAKDRKALIRQHFEIYRDLTWAQEMEPKFRECGVNSAAMKDFREAWNKHAETRDWEWWQAQAKSYSNERLQDMVMDVAEKLDAIGMMQWKQDRFEQALDQAAERNGNGQAKDQTPER